MNELSREQLETASVEVWASWLRDGVLAFTNNSAVEVRVRAFLPFVIDPISHYPAGELSGEIRSCVTDRVHAPASACSLILQSWSLVLDGADGASMIVQLGARLGAPKLFEVSLQLVARSGDAPEDEARWLAWTIVQAAKERFTPPEILQIGQAISRAHLWNPGLFAEFATLLARDSLSRTPVFIAQFAPELFAEPHTGEYSRVLARRLSQEFDQGSLRMALAPASNDSEDISRLRRVISEEIGGRVSNAAWPSQGKDEARLRDVLERFPETGSGEDNPTVMEFEREAIWRAMLEDGTRFGSIPH